MDVMNNIIDWIGRNTKEFPLYIVLLIFGGLGAAFSNYSSKRELTKTQRFVSVISGAFTALFIAVFVEVVVMQIWELKLSGAAMAGIGYFSGHIGLEGVTRLIVRWSSRKDKSEPKDDK
ncbi:MAG: hypothetical protein ACI9N9_000096 [Enterobacterales bacterium]|jgi:hypothetical protein